MTEHCSGSFTKEIANEEDDVSEQPGATGAPSSGLELFSALSLPVRIYPSGLMRGCTNPTGPSVIGI